MIGSTRMIDVRKEFIGTSFILESGTEVLIESWMNEAWSEVVKIDTTTPKYEVTAALGVVRINCTSGACDWNWGNE